MRLLIIGGGNMGGAIVRGCIARNILTPPDIGIIDIDPVKRAEFERLGCNTSDDIRAIASRLTDQTQIVLAVKPQKFADVAQSILDEGIAASRVFISIMAGLESGRIHRALGPGARIVRCMPNTPCQVGRGMTAIALGMGAREGDEDLARHIFDALGLSVMVDESHMHAVTAVSGSGPAYIFLMAEAMQKAAEAIDLPPDVARTLVNQTILGAATMLDEKKADAPSLRQAVTSPGGTTAAALDVFAMQGFEQAVIDAIRAAKVRGVELNR